MVPVAVKFNCAMVPDALRFGFTTAPPLKTAIVVARGTVPEVQFAAVFQSVPDVLTQVKLWPDADGKTATNQSPRHRATGIKFRVILGGRFLQTGVFIRHLGEVNKRSLRTEIAGEFIRLGMGLMEKLY